MCCAGPLSSADVLWGVDILECRARQGRALLNMFLVTEAFAELGLQGGIPSFEPAQDNVALIAVLEALDPPHPEAAAAGRRQLICVANTHIHANPELNDVKLWQARPALTRGGMLLWRLLCCVAERTGRADGFHERSRRA